MAYNTVSTHNVINLYLSKVIDNSNVCWESVPDPFSTDVTFRIQCLECKQRIEQTAANWSLEFDLDSLIDTMVSFSQNHKHMSADTPPERLFILDEQ